MMNLILLFSLMLIHFLIYRITLLYENGNYIRVFIMFIFSIAYIYVLNNF